MKEKSKCKEWERRRRDKLNDAFNYLAQLLPFYDPSKTMTKIDILEKSTQFIKEVRLTNSRLLLEKCQPQETGKKIQQLQDEVNKLILRVKQLAQLLKDANIEIPIGPSIKLLGDKRLKWSEKLIPLDTENNKPEVEVINGTSETAVKKYEATKKKVIKITKVTRQLEEPIPVLQKTVTQELVGLELEKRNIQPVSTVCTTAKIVCNQDNKITSESGTLNLPKSGPDNGFRETENLGENITKSQPIADNGIDNTCKTPSVEVVFSMAQCIQQNPPIPTTTAANISSNSKPVFLNKSQQQTTSNPGEAIFNTAMALNLTSTLTPINFTRQIHFPSLSLQPLRTTFILTTPITCSVPQSSLVQHPLLAHIATNVNSNGLADTNPANILPKHLVPLSNLQKIPIRCIRKPSPRKIYKPRGISKKRKEILEANLATKSSPKVETNPPTLDDKENRECIKLPDEPDSIRSPSPELIDITKDNENEIVKESQLQGDSEKLLEATTINEAIFAPKNDTVENMSGVSQEPIEAICQIASKTPADALLIECILDKSKEVYISKSKSIEESLNVVESLKSIPATKGPEQMSRTSFESENTGDSLKIKEFLSSKRSFDVTSNISVMPDQIQKESRFLEIGGRSVSGTRRDEGAKDLGFPPQMAEKETGAAHSSLSVCIHSNSNSSPSVQVPSNISRKTFLNEPLISSGAREDKTKKTTVEISSSFVVQNLTTLEQKLPAEDEEDGSMNSDDKISECIARSIDLIDEHPACSDLMELSTDWSVVVNSHSSAKSPISPTQMFLSMFPLLPREGIVGENVCPQSHKSGVGLLAGNNSRSSFFIDSMLPDENNSVTPTPTLSHNNSLLESLAALTGVESSPFCWTLPQPLAPSSTQMKTSNSLNLNQRENNKRSNNELETSQEIGSNQNSLTPLKPSKYARLDEFSTIVQGTITDFADSCSFAAPTPFTPSSSIESRFLETFSNTSNCLRNQQSHLTGHPSAADLFNQIRPPSFHGSQFQGSKSGLAANSSSNEPPKKARQSSSSRAKLAKQKVNGASFQCNAHEQVDIPNVSEIRKQTSNHPAKLAENRTKNRGNTSSLASPKNVNVPLLALTQSTGITGSPTFPVTQKNFNAIGQNYYYHPNSQRESQAPPCTAVKKVSTQGNSDPRSQNSNSNTISSAMFIPSNTSAGPATSTTIGNQNLVSHSGRNLTANQTYTPGALFRPASNVFPTQANIDTSSITQNIQHGTNTHQNISHQKLPGDVNKLQNNNISPSSKSLSFMGTSSGHLVPTQRTSQDQYCLTNQPPQYEQQNKTNYNQLPFGRISAQEAGTGRPLYGKSGQNMPSNSNPLTSSASMTYQNQSRSSGEQFPGTNTTHYSAGNTYGPNTPQCNLLPSTSQAAPLQHQPYRQSQRSESVVSNSSTKSSCSNYDVSKSANLPAGKVSYTNQQLPFYLSDPSVQKISNTCSSTGVPTVSSKSQETVFPPLISPAGQNYSAPQNNNPGNNHRSQTQIHCSQNQQAGYFGQHQPGTNTNSRNYGTQPSPSSTRHSNNSTIHINIAQIQSKDSISSQTSGNTSTHTTSSKENYYSHHPNSATNAMPQYPTTIQIHQPDNSRISSVSQHCSTVESATTNSKSNRYVTLDSNTLNNQRHHPTTVNWMTDPPHPPSVSSAPDYNNSIHNSNATNNGKKLARSSNNSQNPFSVSTLVGNGTSTAPGNSNYCTEALIRKNLNNWTDFPSMPSISQPQIHSLVPEQEANVNIPQHTHLYLNPQSANHHHFHQLHTNPNQQYSASPHFNYFENPMNSPAPLHSNIHHSQHIHASASTPSQPQQQFHQQSVQLTDNQHQCHQAPTSSVTNFNLSTIFPEINDKRNNNSNNNSNPTYPGSTNTNSNNMAAHAHQNTAQPSSQSHANNSMQNFNYFVNNMTPK